MALLTSSFSSLESMNVAEQTLQDSIGELTATLTTAINVYDGADDYDFVNPSVTTTSISGLLTNGDHVAATGSFVSFPLTIKTATYTFSESSLTPGLKIQFFGSIVVPEFASESGTITKVIVTDGDTKITMIGSDKVTNVGDTKLTSLQFDSNGVSLLLKGSLLADDDFNISGKITSLTLSQGDSVATFSGFNIDFSVFDSYDNLSDFLALALDGNDVVNGSAHDETINGFVGADNLKALAGTDTVNGGAGNDTLDGGIGADSLIGGAGDDTYLVDNVGDVITELENEGFDNVNVSIASGATYTLSNYLEKATLTNTLAANLVGNDQGDNLIGNVAANNISGGAGNDTIFGGAGNDTLIGGAGGDSIDGGAGIDSMVGGMGDDVYVVDNIADKVVELADEGVDTVKSSLTYTLTENVDNLTLTGAAAINGTGNDLANEITGNANANKLDGGAGIDRLIGGAGNDTLVGGSGVDALLGGVGNDTYVLTEVDAITENSSEGIDTIISSISLGLGASSNIENLTLATVTSVTLDLALNDINAIGNELNNTLIGNIGNNQLSGLAGVDILKGGKGDDTYFVDLATTSNVVNASLKIQDTIVENANEGSADSIVLNAGAFSSNNLSTITIAANIEKLWLDNTTDIKLNVVGNKLNNFITGNNLANKIDGSAGNDQLQGNQGNDSLLGGTGNDLLFGQEGDDTLFGGDGNDELVGGAGLNALAGGIGDDRYDIDLVSDGNAASMLDTITEAKNAGIDLVMLSGSLSVTETATFTLGANLEILNAHYASGTKLNLTGNTLNNLLTGNNLANIIDGDLGNDLVYGEEGNDTIIGGIGNDTLSGNEGNDSLEGGVGNDILDGDAGTDILVGGAGNDTYFLDDVNDLLDDDIVEDSTVGSGEDTVKTIFTDYVLGANLENLVLLGLENIGGSGNELNNKIIGNVANNQLSGLDGNDIFDGGAGNDVLDGGNGKDTLFGGIGNDTLIGGAEGDSLIGGLGDDVYQVNLKPFVEGASFSVAEDVIIESVAGGIDTLVLYGDSILYQLNTNIENLDLSYLTSNPFFTYGNGLNNDIKGHATHANNLDGGAGSDTLHGGAGRDYLIGGAGADSLIGGDDSDYYEVDNLGDQVVDDGTFGFDRIVGKISIDLNNYSNIEEVELKNGTGNLSATGNASNNVVSGNDGNNKLDGGAGNDTVYGNYGNDTMTGGLGADTLLGGAGLDIFDFNAINESGFGSDRDVIFGFSHAAKNKIDFSTVDANDSLEGNQAFTFIGADVFGNVAGQLRYVSDNVTGNYNNGFITDIFTGGTLSGDVNGDGVADFEIVMIGVTSLAVSDFIL